jgi:hypothetical protein
MQAHMHTKGHEHMAAFDWDAKLSSLPGQGQIGDDNDNDDQDQQCAIVTVTLTLALGIQHATNINAASRVRWADYI